MKQDTLFENSTSLMSIREIATDLNVSEASVRNWIKTGYLKTHKKYITEESFDFFKKNVIGKEKLNKRANKSRLDNHDHGLIASIFVDKVRNANSILALKNISNEYETSLSNSYRNKEGVYYTPFEIIETMFSEITEDKSDLFFCDLYCGSGNFLAAAIKHGVKPENVYGFDLDPIAVEIARKRIQKITNGDAANIRCENFLDFASNLTNNTHFDIIMTNPPWGKKMPKKTKEIYGRELSAGKCQDTCALFYFACKKIVKENGFIGLLLPGAFFNVAMFSEARKDLLKYKILSFYDFERPFKGLLTKAKSFVLQLSLSDNANIEVKCHSQTASHSRNQASFINNPSFILNFSCSPEEDSVLARMYEKPHVHLDTHTKWGLGIVTGNNKKYCSEEPKVDYIPVYKGADIQKNYIERPSAYIPNDFSLYQQVAPCELYQAKEKLIYRFMCSELIFFYDDKQRYFLNSANMLIIQNGFPLTTQQVGKLLNMQVMSWAFKKLFETHKVLRADIEHLPIYSDFIGNNPGFDEMTLLDYLGVEKADNGTYRIKD